MICYKGILNGDEMIIKVEDDSPLLTVIDFEENDPEIINLYQKQINEQEILRLKQQLFNTDYIACKIAEGAATREEYAFELEERRNWRARINELEQLLK